MGVLIPNTLKRSVAVLTIALVLPLTGCDPVTLAMVAGAGASVYSAVKSANNAPEKTAPEQKTASPPTTQPAPLTAQAPPIAPESKPVVTAKATTKAKPPAAKEALGKSKGAEVRKIRNAQSLKGEFWWSDTYQKWYLLDSEGEQWVLKERRFEKT